MKKDVQIVVLVTDKEAAVFFPNENNEPDLSMMFYSSNKKFMIGVLNILNGHGRIHLVFRNQN